MTESDTFSMDQVKELFDSYTKAGLADTSSGRFLQSIISEDRMPRGGGHRWLSDLIHRGLNEENTRRAAEILRVSEGCSRDDIREDLRSFSQKIAAGKILTDRQTGYLESIMRQAQENAPDVELTQRETELLRILSVEKRYNVYYSIYYWSGRPAIAGRIDRIFKRYEQSGKVSVEDFGYLKSNMKGIAETFMGTSVKHPEGSLRWYRGTPVTVISDARFDDSARAIRIDVITPSGMESIDPRDLRSRRQ
jgi:hypothetical protein